MIGFSVTCFLMRSSASIRFLRRLASWKGRALYSAPFHAKGRNTMNPLDTIKGTLIAGLVIALALTAVISAHAGFNDLLFMRWLHIAAGVTWIGLLYYFNFVQVP